MTLHKIAIVAPNIAGAGGVSTVARFLYRELERSPEFDPRLFSLAVSYKDQASLRLLSPSTWLRGVNVLDRKWGDWSYQHIGAVASELEVQRYMPRPKLTSLLSRHDLVQIVSGTPAWAYTARDLSQPVCLQVATLTLVERDALLRGSFGMQTVWRWVMSLLATQIEDSALQKMSAVFVENHWMYRHLRLKIPEDRVIFAPPGVDTTRFFPGPYVTGGYILCVGRLGDPRKNVELLIQAYHRLCEQLPTAPSLVLAGKSLPNQRVLKKADSLGLGDRIILMKDVSAARLVRLYRGASLFVLSSHEEGLGLVLLEAMASGIPVVATRCGGPETVVAQGKTGFLVPKGDAAELASAMRRILADQSKARRMGMAARKKVEEEFSLDAAASHFLRQYRKLLN